MGMVTMGLGDTAECKLFDSSSVVESEDISFTLEEEEIRFTIEIEDVCS